MRFNPIPWLAALGLVVTLTTAVWPEMVKSINVDAAGNPLDWNGPSSRCPECKQESPWVGGYLYRCHHCQHLFEVRHQPERFIEREILAAAARQDQATQY